MAWPVVVMNFTGAYDNEDFVSHPGIRMLDCRHLSGTDCYCDAEAAQKLRQMISGLPVEGIHFIDSGNHHYMTKFWTDMIHREFSLVVFDHHPDMQPPLFEGMLSCGGWVRDMLEGNPFLRKVLVVGASDNLVRETGGGFDGRVRFYCESALGDEESWRSFSREHVSEPVYISVDKDVLDPDSASTDWDQGSMTLAQLERALSMILRNEDVIGVDICGECPQSVSLLGRHDLSSELNNRANVELARLFERQHLSSVPPTSSDPV